MQLLKYCPCYMSRGFRVGTKRSENFSGCNSFGIWPPRVVIRHGRDESIAIIIVITTRRKKDLISKSWQQIRIPQQGTVPDLGLPRELRFWQHAHVDQVSSPLTIHVTLGPRGELWTLHAHYALARDELHSTALGRQRMSDGAFEPLYQPAAEWIAKSGVSDDGRALEETRGAYALGAVNDLRRQCERAWGDILAEGADGAECKDGAHT